MAKLNNYVAYLASITRVPPNEITEIVRALKAQSDHFKEGDFDPTAEFRARSGPGGGVDVTPFHVAFLLIALMVNANRRDTAVMSWRGYSLKFGVRRAAWRGEEPTIPTCPITGETTFGAALTKCIASPTEYPVKWVRLAVREDHGARGDWAEIHFENGAKTRFGKDESRGFERVGEIDGQTIQVASQMANVN